MCDYDVCCDGSEEWSGVNGVKCQNRCEELGKEWRAREGERSKAKSAAEKRREDMLVQVQRLRREIQDRVVTLKEEVEAKKTLVTKMEAELAEIEKVEKEKVVKAPKGGGANGVLLTLVREKIEELRQALMGVREERNTLKERLVQVEGMLKRLKEEHDPYLLDKGVKGVVQSWEEYVTRDKGSEKEAGAEKDLDELLKPDEESGINWDEWEDNEPSDGTSRRFSSLHLVQFQPILLYTTISKPLIRKTQSTT